MIELVIIICALLITLVCQHVYWMRQTQKLIDKLMSRNYSEYVQAASPLSPGVRVPFKPAPDDFEDLSGLPGV